MEIGNVFDDPTASITYIVPRRLIRGLILVSAFDLHGSLTFWSGLIEICRAFHIVVSFEPKLKVKMDLEC